MRQPRSHPDHRLGRGRAAAGRRHRAASDVDAASLLDRRGRVLGPAIESLSYTEPIRMASASGTWMTDEHGRRYLDAYNNVPCVGHAHPRVTSAIARQSRLLNTNMRYLHGSAIELAERLVATCPPSLDTVFFVNSGSEANDLAWRLATHATGHTGGVCTAFAYHGISHAIAPLSPESLPADDVDAARRALAADRHVPAAAHRHDVVRRCARSTGGTGRGARGRHPRRCAAERRRVRPRARPTCRRWSR